MKLPIPLKKTLLVGCALLVTTFIPPVARGADESGYSFKVHNTTKEKITKILVSADGEKYGYFDIGNGIGIGRSALLSRARRDPELLVRPTGLAANHAGRHGGDLPSRRGAGSRSPALRVHHQ